MRDGAGIALEIAMRTMRWVNAMLCATALSACGTESHAGDGGMAPEPGPEPIQAPPLLDIFGDLDGDGLPGHMVNIGTSLDPVYETRYLFDETRLRELCLLPDADSFDDYEERDSSGRVTIPRSTTPLSTDCPADGIATGPLRAMLEPSSWCRVEGCEPEESGASSDSGAR